MSVEDGRGRPSPAREGALIMKASAETQATTLNGSGKENAASSDAHPANEAAAAKNKAAAKPKVASPAKPRKAARRPPQASRSPNPDKLVCRYCGSDDLAPSFKKRRDARCRACFKQRYSSRVQQKKSTPARKAKTAK